VRTESRHPDSIDLDEKSSQDVAAMLLDAQVEAARIARSAAPAVGDAAEAAAERVRQGGRLVYAGAGTSGRLSMQDAAELLPTFGFDRTRVLMAGGEAAGSRAKEGAEDDVSEAATAVKGAHLTPNDVVIGVAASGRTPYTQEVLRLAREVGSLTIAIANNPGARLLEGADHAILLDTGPEVLTGSTRLAAGTAQKAVLNTLSTTIMVRLGEVYGNLMVGMQATNVKLERRAVQIVQDATGCSHGAAQRNLEACGYDVKTAIVMQTLGLASADARARLERHRGNVREALSSAPE